MKLIKFLLSKNEMCRKIPDKIINRHIIYLLATAFLVFICNNSLLSKPIADFPPFHVYKISMGDKVVPFDFVDLNGRSWSNRSFLRKPLVLITGSWKLRHDLRKWADYLSFNHILKVDILWIFNPSTTIFSDQKKRSTEAFANFSTSVPVIIDNHSLIGRSLKIDYDIPTIIGIDRLNRYQFSHAAPFNKQSLEVVRNLIKSRL